VGVLEDLNSTLTVLEHYIPRFFRGATRVYNGKSTRGVLHPSHSLKVLSGGKKSSTLRLLFFNTYMFCDITSRPTVIKENNKRKKKSFEPDDCKGRDTIFNIIPKRVLS
jgi:hypothetical protein